MAGYDAFKYAAITGASILLNMLIWGSTALSSWIAYSTDGKTDARDVLPSYIILVLVNICILTYIVFRVIKNRIYSDNFSIVFVVFILLAGTFFEMFMLYNYHTMPDELGTYFMILFNLVARLYYSTELSVVLTSEFAKAAATGKAATSSGTPAAAAPAGDKGKKMLDRFDAIVADIRAKNPGVDIKFGNAKKYVQAEIAKKNFSNAVLDKAKADIGPAGITKGGSR